VEQYAAIEAASIARKETTVADLAIEVVKAIAAGTGDTLATKGIDAVGRLISALRMKFRSDPGSRGTLEITLDTPDDLAARDNLVALLHQRILHDTEFSAWLERLWDEVGPDILGDASKSANIVQGDVRGNVVQTRDVQGGIHIGRDDATSREPGDDAREMDAD
jgi:Mn-containing catalase